ncbi:hypothetical protein JCM16496A_28420 [Bacteroides rodentium JCM 16496]
MPEYSEASDGQKRRFLAYIRGYKQGIIQFIESEIRGFRNNEGRTSTETEYFILQKNVQM